MYLHIIHLNFKASCNRMTQERVEIRSPFSMDHGITIGATETSTFSPLSGLIPDGYFVGFQWVVTAVDGLATRVFALRPNRRSNGVPVGRCVSGLSLTAYPKNPCKIPTPSVFPTMAEAARSGCGIMPNTFRPELQIPAILRLAPFGFASDVGCPSPST